LLLEVKLMINTPVTAERRVYDQLVCSRDPANVHDWIELTVSKDVDLVGVPILPGFLYAMLVIRPTTWWHCGNSDFQIQWENGFADLYLTRTGRIIVYASFRKSQSGYYLVDASRYDEPFDNREWAPAGQNINHFIPCICVDWRTAWLGLAHIFITGELGSDSPWIESSALRRRFDDELIRSGCPDDSLPEWLYWGP
jgi:hypothetical protein